MSNSTLDIAVLSDIHYVHHALHRCPIPKRHAQMGRELLGRALSYIRYTLNIDLVVLLGDLVDNGKAELVEKDLEEIKEELDRFGLQYFVVPGNHDADVEVMQRVFSTTPGVKEMDNALLFLFFDTWNERDEAKRDEQEMREFYSVVRDSAKPLVVFQHNPVYPDIESGYPYNLVNSAQVRDDYTRSRVLLSVSAHFHRGIKPVAFNDVNYVTCPALCEEPFRFLHITVDTTSVEVTDVSLAPDELRDLEDIHVHSMTEAMKET